MKFSTYHLIITASALGLAVGSQAQVTANWTGAGADDEYTTALNWDTGLVPTVDDSAVINGDFTVERTLDSTSRRTFIRGGATVNINGGVHDDSGSGANTFNFVGDTSAGTVNQTAGTNTIGHGLRVGVGNENADGTYNLSGGALTLFRGSNSKVLAGVVGAPRPSLEVGDIAGSGLFEISGTASLQTRGPAHIAANGTFSVVGSGHTPSVAGPDIGIGSNGSGDGGWFQSGTLQAAVDGGGLTSIFVDDVDDTLGVVTAEFASGSLLDLGFDGISPINGTWTLLEIENTDIADNGLALSADTASDWSFAIDNSGANGLLTISFSGAAGFIDGDYDGNGFVSQADLDLVLLNWGEATVPAEWLATEQFDGFQVSQNELDGVLLNWGNGTPPSAVAAVPEPASLALLGLGGAALATRRRRK